MPTIFAHGEARAHETPFHRVAVLPGVGLAAPFPGFMRACHLVSASRVSGGSLPSGGSTIRDVRSDIFGRVGSALQNALYSAPAIRYPGRPSSGLSAFAYRCSILLDETFRNVLLIFSGCGVVQAAAVVGQRLPARS